MDFKLVLLLSALGMTCAGSIQDPYIHDSAEDQIAMESGPSQTVVAAPPHIRAAAAAAAIAAAAAETAQAEADQKAAEADADNEVAELEVVELEADNELPEPEADSEVAEPEADTDRPAVPFTVLVNDEPVRSASLQPAAPLRPVSLQPVAPLRPSFGGSLGFRRPSLSPLIRMSLLSRLQQQQYGAPLGGYGASPVILLQPIIVPVPMSASDAESQPNALTERVMSSLLMRETLQPRPLSLMDLLQRGYYNF